MSPPCSYWEILLWIAASTLSFTLFSTAISLSFLVTPTPLLFFLFFLVHFVFFNLPFLDWFFTFLCKVIYNNTILAADKIGIPHAQPLYNQNGPVEAILNGLNFGSPQATIMSSGQSYQSLNQQLRQVLDAIQLLRLRLGQHATRHFIQSSLFYLSFGEVDFINLYLLNSTEGMYGGEEFARLLVSQMVIAIRNLQEAGARKIVCMGILPLGCTPRVLSQWRDSPAATFDEKGCVKEMNELVGKYNKVMGEEMVKLNAEFGDAQMVFCDAYKGMMEIIGNPTKYGFKESRSACCGVGWNNASVVGCVAMEIACREVRRYVWWDLYNPTAAVNSLLADSAWRNQPLSTLCHPSNIQDLLLT
ncbi:GDSL esterase/lipase At1g71250-like [Benincasa hispida]|uniref:GDSL esterase/lipase At1g71250-like n=1 Tax=Benincasa hispida TaxID=102211 RepID=UPI0019013C26|nr:GDSL esterase/lipase At1g71250-like [Benincasa hispida]